MAGGTIIPNLKVADIATSLAFYRDALGFEVAFLISAARDMLPPDRPGEAVFASLKWGEAELMLQTVESLASELDGVAAAPPAGVPGTVYLRGYSPDEALARVPPDSVVQGPLRQWYGMTELYLRDPDGHILCLGVPEGPSPD